MGRGEGGRLSAIACRGLQYRYPAMREGECAFGALTFSIPVHGFCAIIGPSGSGKTTLLDVIAGDLPPSGGCLQLGSRDDGDQGTRISRLHQDGRLIPFLTSAENIEIAAELSDSPPTVGEELLEALGLTTVADRYPRDLSGGEAQRIALVRAVASCPTILLADEPTASLDHDNSVEVADALQGLATHLKTTVVVATHDPVVYKRADQIVELEALK